MFFGKNSENNGSDVLKIAYIFSRNSALAHVTCDNQNFKEV